MDENQTRPERPARARAIGAGLYRERDGAPMNWSEDWPFVERRKLGAPGDTFQSEATPLRRRRSTDPPLPS